MIGDFDDASLRADLGRLWENFLVSERRKQNSYKLTFAKSYFWRTNQQQEIDYVEQVGSRSSAYKFKWNPKRKVSISKTFLNNYEVEGLVISREDFRSFIKI